jgi:hypothetical protein
LPDKTAHSIEEISLTIHILFVKRIQ